MEVGISTASLFEREKTEGALLKLNNLGVKVGEVFLESYCEYTKKFGKIEKWKQTSLVITVIQKVNCEIFFQTRY